LAGTGIAGANGGEIVNGNARALQSEARAIAYRCHGASKADAHGIGRAAAALREDAALRIDKDAVSFGAAAVKAESQFHETRIREPRNFRSGGLTVAEHVAANQQRTLRASLTLGASATILKTLRGEVSNCRAA
jgi:hypothetical protein